jgi:lipopolysaccharide biosynthesis regulator YciM
MLDQPGQAGDGTEMYWLTWACALAPDAVPRYDTIVRGLEKAVVDHPTACRYRHSLGSILFRTGQFKGAVEQLNAALQCHQQTGLPLLPSDWLFLAMAHQRLGNAAEARKWLDKAVQSLDKTAEEKAKGKAAEEPFDWIEPLKLEILRREAEKLLGEPAKPALAAQPAPKAPGAGK